MSHDQPTDSSSESDHDHEHHGGIGQYIVVFLCLCGLTGLSFGVASSPIMETPSIGWAVMMAISCAKAMLVILFFMHLLWEANWKYVLTIPAAMMSVFLVCMLVPDVGKRVDHYSQERWLHAAEPHHESSTVEAEEHHDEDMSESEHDHHEK